MAADDTDVWLVPNDAIWHGPVPADAGPAGPLALLGRILDELGYPSADPAATVDVRPGVLGAYPTSWRWINDDRGPRIILTFVVALEVPAGEVVPNLHLVGPGDRPVHTSLLDDAGPGRHGPGRGPDVRDVHVLLHGLRHLALLCRYYPQVREVLGPQWWAHLRRLEPAADVHVDADGINILTIKAA